MRCKACHKKINREKWKKFQVCFRCKYQIDISFNNQQTKKEKIFHFYTFYTDTYIVNVLLDNKIKFSYIYTKKSNQAIIRADGHRRSDISKYITCINKLIPPTILDSEVNKYLLLR